jgi:hypothetical protein
MADFRIGHQQAQNINQADVINIGTLATWEEATGRLQLLLAQVAQLVDNGRVDHQVGSHLQVAISDAVAAPDDKGRLKALLTARNIAAGTSILAGIAQTLSSIVAMIPR